MAYVAVTVKKKLPETQSIDRDTGNGHIWLCARNCTFYRSRSLDISSPNNRWTVTHFICVTFNYIIDLKDKILRFIFI